MQPALKNVGPLGAWVAQCVKASAFGSGHDLRVLGSSPTLGSLLSRKPASLSSTPPVYCVPSLTISLSFSVK